MVDDLAEQRTRAGCLKTCLGFDTRFRVSRSRCVNVSSTTRTLQVLENGHVSIETGKILA